MYLQNGSPGSYGHRSLSLSGPLFFDPFQCFVSSCAVFRHRPRNILEINPLAFEASLKHILFNLQKYGEEIYMHGFGDSNEVPKKINDDMKQKLELSTKVNWRNKSYVIANYKMKRGSP